MPYPRPTINTHVPPGSYTAASCDSPSPPHSPTTSRGHRPSLSRTMGWLSRSSTQSSVASAKPTRISEPTLIHTDLMSPRAGILGSGATVVRTPDEALRDTRVRLTYEQSAGQQQEPEEAQELEYSPRTSAETSSEEEDECPSPLDSPPLPPLPSDEKERAESLSEPTIAQPFSFPPVRAVPAAPISALRPSLKTRRTESVDDASVVPALPSNISFSPVTPSFNPILVSAPPATADHSRIIVSLETCTATYKTTLDTLSSRPSHLSSYIDSQFGRRRSSISSSVYSTASASEDMSTYRRHLVSQDLIPPCSTSVHIFLDRPSEPYVHILSYLRCPQPGEGPEVLPPRATQAGLDVLLELRDEAAYLGLEGLHKLCVEEIRQRHRSRPRGSARGHSGAPVSTHSLQGSVSSLHTMLEQVEPQHSRGRSKDSRLDEIGNRSPPTPDSLIIRRVQSQSRYGSLRPPPAGWI
ncbi:hypothetical protein GGX14DRAFT_614014, partial [Mycena pura]